MPVSGPVFRYWQSASRVWPPLGVPAAPRREEAEVPVRGAYRLSSKPVEVVMGVLGSEVGRWDAPCRGRPSAISFLADGTNAHVVADFVVQVRIYHPGDIAAKKGALVGPRPASAASYLRLVAKHARMALHIWERIPPDCQAPVAVIGAQVQMRRQPTGRRKIDDVDGYINCCAGTRVVLRPDRDGVAFLALVVVRDPFSGAGSGLSLEQCRSSGHRGR